MKTLNEREAVHCKTQEEFDIVVKELNKQGHKWYAKTFGNICRFEQYGDKTCLSFFVGGKYSGHLSYNHVSTAKDQEWKIYSFAEFTRDDQTSKRKEN